MLSTMCGSRDEKLNREVAILGHYQCEYITRNDLQRRVVQLKKTGERTNGRWNGSRELIGVQVAVIEHGIT